MGIRTAVARLLIALALIVQIWAPVGSSAAMVRAAFDPLVDIIVCAQDQEVVDRKASPDPLAVHHGDACGLCQLVAAGGHAPPPAIVALEVPAETARLVDWRRTHEPVALASRLAHIRGRAPPTLS